MPQGERRGIYTLPSAILKSQAKADSHKAKKPATSTTSTRRTTEHSKSPKHSNADITMRIKTLSIMSACITASLMFAACTESRTDDLTTNKGKKITITAIAHGLSLIHI